jgi:hypothetical protein
LKTGGALAYLRRSLSVPSLRLRGDRVNCRVSHLQQGKQVLDLTIVQLERCLARLADVLRRIDAGLPKNVVYKCRRLQQNASFRDAVDVQPRAATCARFMLRVVVPAFDDKELGDIGALWRFLIATRIPADELPDAVAWVKAVNNPITAGEPAGHCHTVGAGFLAVPLPIEAIIGNAHPTRTPGLSCGAAGQDIDFEGRRRRLR